MTQKIYQNVKIGENSQIGDFVIIGLPPKGKADGELPTIIGDNAVIRSHTIIYAGNTIGNNLQTGHHALIRENNKIGNNVSVGSYCHVAFDCLLEDDVRLHTAAHAFEKSILRKGCWLGPGVMLANAKYPAASRTKEFISGCEIEERGKIGMNATLLPGIKVGKNALVGAGAVVTKDVAPNEIVVGNPAKVIGNVNSIKYPEGGEVYPEEE